MPDTDTEPDTGILDHHHTLAVTSAQPAPEGINGRTVIISCSECTYTHTTITLRGDKEIQDEIDAYNAGEGDG